MHVAVAHFGAILDVAITIQVIVHRAPSLEQRNECHVCKGLDET